MLRKAPEIYSRKYAEHTCAYKGRRDMWVVVVETSWGIYHQDLTLVGYDDAAVFCKRANTTTKYLAQP